ncbi:MAG: LCP family protein [Candidatus Pelethousia sp.]|nr:LCP family protein [Candidatus Pelethousia sp.]
MRDVTERIKRRRRAVRAAWIVLAVFVLLCLGVGGYVAMLWRNGDRLNRATMFRPGETEQITLARGEDAAALPTAQPSQTPALYEGKATISYAGKYYVLNEDIFSILFMGIDTTDAEQFQDIGVTAHQADSLILAVVAPTANKLTMINIPRMTITEIRQLDANFNYSRTTESPLCIQYAFGDGKEQSCNLTREAVRNLLFHIPISRYISMNLDGLFAANDAIGGVEVLLLDDFTDVNPSMQKGERYVLTGRDAETYVRGRIGKNLDGTNMSRTKRQVQYYKAFFAAAKAKLKEDPMFAVDLYSSLGGSIQTDLTMEEVIYLSKTVANMDMDDENIHTLEGTVKNEDFFVDDDALRELLIRVFYTEVGE